MSNAASLNRDCQCSVTDLSRLRERIDRVTGAAQPIVQTHPNLFAELPVFLERSHFEEMRRSIQMIEKVAASAAYQELVLAQAPPIARRPVSPRGVFLGFDFHISAEGPRLIEINTNAGGAFLNMAGRDAQIACCDAMRDLLPDGSALGDIFTGMFLREWQLARPDAPLRRIAIVDDKPQEQFLFPEFQLARALLESKGMVARIADIRELELRADQLTLEGEAVDLVYNRSTDFYLESPEAATLRAAYENDLAVVTPHPRAHALYANKRNLAILSDSARLAALGIDAGARECLARVIPATREVTGAEEDWWAARKAWFFKPESGFGSRGAYRGDKMTRRVFAEISKGRYIAQELTPAGERTRRAGDTTESMKVDIRSYVYDGDIQLMAARLYQGQTTNFRTAGGGFAPVHVVS